MQSYPMNKVALWPSKPKRMHIKFKRLFVETEMPQDLFKSHCLLLLGTIYWFESSFFARSSSLASFCPWGRLSLATSSSSTSVAFETVPD